MIVGINIAYVRIIAIYIAINITFLLILGLNNCNEIFQKNKKS